MSQCHTHQAIALSASQLQLLLNAGIGAISPTRRVLSECVSMRQRMLQIVLARVRLVPGVPGRLN